MTSVGKFRQEIEATYKKDTRKTYLDLRPHFVPVTKEILNLTIKHVLSTKEDIEEQGYGEYASINEIYSKLVSFISGRFPVSVDISNLPEDFVENIDTYLPCAIHRSGKLTGVLFKNYRRAQENLFQEFASKELTKYLKDSRYASTKISKGFDVGHVVADEIGSTPLLEQLKNLKTAIDSSVHKSLGDTTAIQKTVDSAIATLIKRSSYGRRIKATLTKDFSDFLVSVNANLVIIQDRYENQYIYGNQVELLQVANVISRELKKVNFSNNIIEDIISRTVARITGKKVKSTKSQVKIQEITIEPSVKIRSKTTSAKGKATNKPTVQKPSTSAASLEAILRASINEEVTRNMGSGDETRILNYRTGRFASSVEIDRVSQSRAGLISVFYSYMKNPYATFSDGGRQQYPKTRDPKLLISRSIRNIAAPIVGNRLRSIVV